MLGAAAVVFERMRHHKPLMDIRCVTITIKAGYTEKLECKITQCLGLTDWRMPSTAVLTCLAAANAVSLNGGRLAASGWGRVGALTWNTEQKEIFQLIAHSTMLIILPRLMSKD